MKSNFQLTLICAVYLTGLLLSPKLFAKPQVYQCAQSLRGSQGPGHYLSWPMEDGAILLPTGKGEFFLFQKNTDKHCRYEIIDPNSGSQHLVYNYQGQNLYMTIFPNDNRVDCCQTYPDEDLQGTKIWRWRLGNLYRPIQCRDQRSERSKKHLIGILKKRVDAIAELSRQDQLSAQHDKRHFDAQVYYDILKPCASIPELTALVQQAKKDLELLHPSLKPREDEDRDNFDSSIVF